MSVAETLDLLTPGTVWLRRDGSQAKFLFVTNTALSPKTQVAHPPQVIYSDSKGNIFNRDIDDFFRVYTFLNVDAELEKKIENLFVFNEADYETVNDPEDDEPVVAPADENVSVPPSIKVPESDTEETLAESLLRDLTNEKEKTEGEESALTAIFGIGANEALVNPTLTPADLAAALALYSQEPNKVYNLTQHRLLFKLSDKVTIANLVEAFHPSSERNTVDWFAIKTAITSDTIVWDSWIGVYPEFSAHGLYASVLIGSSENPVDEEPTPGIEAAEVPAVVAEPAPLPIVTSGYAQIVGDVAQSVTLTAAPGISLNSVPALEVPNVPVTPVPETQVLTAGADMDPAAGTPAIVAPVAPVVVAQPVVQPVIVTMAPAIQPAVQPVTPPVTTAA